MAPVPSPIVSSSSLLPSFSVPSSASSSASTFSSATLPFFPRPVAPDPSALLPPQAPSFSYAPGFHPSLSSSPSLLHSSSGFPAVSSLGAPVAAVLGLPASSDSQGASVTPPFFLPFVSSSTSSVPSAPSAPPLSSSADVPPSASSFFPSAPAFDPTPAFGFASADDLPEDSPPDAVPHVLDPGFAAVPEAARSEFRRILAFIVDLFPQAAGSPSVPPPLHALFEDFFSSSAPSSSSPIYLNWFERIRSALSEADSCLASFVASGCGDFLLPSRSPVYAVHGDFALGGAAPVNPSLLSLLDRKLKPSHHLGLSIREAAAFEGSLRSHSEALSISMWVLSALLAFVRLQRFAPEDAALFSTLVTSLSESLAHQANLTVTHTAFLGLKCRQFFLSHLPSYFSEVSKRAMLSSPVVLASSLFAEDDVARLLAETQTSASVRSQQALVEVVSRGSGARFRRNSPARSPSRASSSRRRRRNSGSPPRPQKSVRFDSPAPSSALRGGKSGFRK